jgi:hypothetical protein
MSTPRTDKHKFGIGESDHFAVHEIYSRELETELAAMTKERDAFRASFCNGPAYDTKETPEQARERWDKQALIEGVSAVIIAREAIKERDDWADKCLSTEFRLVCAKAENIEHEEDYMAIWRLIKKPNEHVVDAVKRVIKERDAEREKVSKLRASIEEAADSVLQFTILFKAMEATK